MYAVVKNGVVVDVINLAWWALSKYYGADVINSAIAAPEEVEQGWVYDSATNEFSPPRPDPELGMTIEEAMMDMMTDLDYRTSLLELGITGGNVQ